MYRIFHDSKNNLVLHNGINQGYRVNKTKSNLILFYVQFDDLNKFSAQLEIVATNKEFRSLSFSYTSKRNFGVNNIEKFILTNSQSDKELTIYCTDEKSNIEYFDPNCKYNWQPLLDNLSEMANYCKTESLLHSKMNLHCEPLLEQFREVYKLSVSSFKSDNPTAAGANVLDIILGILSAEKNLIKNIFLMDQVSSQQFQL